MWKIATTCATAEGTCIDFGNSSKKSNQGGVDEMHTDRRIRLSCIPVALAALNSDLGLIIRNIAIFWII